MLHGFRQQWAVVADPDVHLVLVAIQPEDDLAASGGKAGGVVDQLVQHLRHQVRHTDRGQAVQRTVEDQPVFAVEFPVGRHQLTAQRDEVIVLRRIAVHAFLQPRRLAHGGQDIAEPGQSLAGTLHIDITVGIARLEVVQGGLDHRDRCAQFVRKFS